MAPSLLWSPNSNQIQTTNIKQLMNRIESKTNLKFTTYHDFYNWSIENLEEFWKEVWDFTGIIADRTPDLSLRNPEKMPGAEWFPGVKINFAENLLKYRDDKTALISYLESGSTKTISYKELYSQVSKTARALKSLGIKKGDRVSAYMPNLPETIIFMLAATSIGAVWSSSSPDFGVKGVLDRFGQIEPQVLITSDGYFYKGKEIPLQDKIKEIRTNIQSLKKVCIVKHTNSKIDFDSIPDSIYFDEFIKNEKDGEIEFERIGFNEPVYIMYSSGTTGLPKCIVQGPGVLVNHLKELVFHTDLKREDKIFYFTTCGWMMWNWLTSSLGVGAALVLFEGNPFHPGPEALWRMADTLGVTVFGTSAKYLSALEAENYSPKKDFSLSSLRAVLSTGSPLSIESFHYVYREIKSDIQLSSISGGTDLNGCFGIGNPILPVYEGELQCRGLGMKVEIRNEEGTPIQNEKGELVCTAPFPSMPLYFWNDPDGKKYKSSYFEKYPGIWCHGDFAELTERNGLVIHGRSDATLNPGGVRIGTAEIYRVIETLEEVGDSLVIGLERDNDVKVTLFLKMKPGFALTDELKSKIKTAIKNNASPRHVPEIILQVEDIPYTLNMKKVELAVKNILHGRPVTNKDSLINPECLEFYRNLKI